MGKTPQWDPTLPEKGRQAWMKAKGADREEALKHATQFIDTLPFKGERLNSVEGLSWPRKGVFRDDGAPIIGVPHEIKEATSLVAGFILAKTPFDAPALAHVLALIGHLIEDGRDLRNGKITWH